MHQHREPTTKLNYEVPRTISKHHMTSPLLGRVCRRDARQLGWLQVDAISLISYISATVRVGRTGVCDTELICQTRNSSVSIPYARHKECTNQSAEVYSCIVYLERS